MTLINCYKGAGKFFISKLSYTNHSNNTTDMKNRISSMKKRILYKKMVNIIAFC